MLFLYFQFMKIMLKVWKLPRFFKIVLICVFSALLVFLLMTICAFFFQNLEVWNHQTNILQTLSNNIIPLDPRLSHFVLLSRLHTFAETNSIQLSQESRLNFPNFHLKSNFTFKQLIKIGKLQHFQNVASFNPASFFQREVPYIQDEKGGANFGAIFSANYLAEHYFQRNGIQPSKILYQDLLKCLQIEKLSLYPTKIVNFMVAHNLSVSTEQDLGDPISDYYAFNEAQRNLECPWIGLSKIRLPFKWLSGVEQISSSLVFSPVLAAVDATRWFSYKGGRFQNCTPNVTLNHYVVIVGKGVGYWKILNSWGPKWGDRGFIKLPIGACGIATKAFTFV